MGTRAFDATLVGIILMIPIFLGSVFLLIDIPIFNSVTPLSLATAALGLGLGLIFGLFAGKWYTQEQLRILTKNLELKGVGSKKMKVALYVGLAMFLAFSFFTLYFNANVLAYSPSLFVISATFTLSVMRISLINSWERHEEKIIMMDWNKFYVIPYPPQF